MTKKVTCTLPNASDEINGIAFDVTDDGAIASGLTDDEAAQFQGIPGYLIQDDDAAPARGKRGPKPSAAAEPAQAAAADPVTTTTEGA